ncbi:hypothetical protein [Amycolatopsis sp. NPDC098790]|uniref:hypothetical protein n=1 Tax=Amycolatopsis sp. NPDC098790 TaxID=3363939 RepID=UPI00380D61E3
MTETVAFPDREDLIEYMHDEGWAPISSGTSGELWSKGERYLAVPSDNDRDLVKGVIERLAVANRINISRMSEEIRFRRMDVADFRSQIDSSIADTISLDAAISVTSSAKSLLKSAAATSTRPRGDLRNSYGPFARNFTSAARMAHTKRGSFIIPIIVPLSRVQSPAPAEQSSLVEIHRSAPEPFERRTMRTLAQALDAVSSVIVDPGVQPTARSLHAAVELGVSRQLCNAISNILVQPSISELETVFKWAPSVRAPSTIPTAVTIPAEGVELVQWAANLLKTIKIEPSRVFSGVIVGLHHRQEEEFGDITISTVRNGKAADVTARVPVNIYMNALQWHAQVRPLTIEGKVEPFQGRSFILQPVRCIPTDELSLAALDD